MGLHLSALIPDLITVWRVALTVIALGMVIFVHELGHFAVAKLCGVKCEKFYLGFDIGGWKFWKFQWGETEYGIGILPLGGYVKMLGQEDNPARLREEIERAKQQQPGGTGLASGTPPPQNPLRSTPWTCRGMLKPSKPSTVGMTSIRLAFSSIRPPLGPPFGSRTISGTCSVF